ncbi:hypothetical protein BGZ46_002672 [Entomortierella lignicola]|nr:hypothetical protein BGZ46_002672 [Entomortierella lignicola]
MQRAISILEILERIISFLPQQSLRHVASLVCKGWLALSRPLLVREFHWIDAPKTILVTLPITRLATAPSTNRNPRQRNEISFWGWSHSRGSSSQANPGASRHVTVSPEPTWLLKQVENLTTLRCSLSPRTFYATSTIAHLHNGNPEELPALTIVSTTMEKIQNQARSDLIHTVNLLTKRSKLSLLDLQVEVLDDFNGFLKPILEGTPMLTSLWLKRCSLPILPIGLVLSLCQNLEDLFVECEANSARPRMVMVLFEGSPSMSSSSPSSSALDFTNESGQDNPGVDKKQSVNFQGDILPRMLKLKRLRLKDILLKESTLLAIMDASPALYELKIQSLDIPPILGIISLLTPTQDPLSPSPTNTDEQGSEAIVNEDWVSCDHTEFLQEIGQQYPQLTSVHFTRAHHRYTDLQIRTILGSFPCASKWSIVWRDLPDGILRDLNKCIEVPRSPRFLNHGLIAGGLPKIYTNHLTSLDIVPSLDWTPRWGNALHDFLCTSPHLEHLRAGTIECYIENLDINGLLSVSEGPLPTIEDDNDGRGGTVGENIQSSHHLQKLNSIDSNSQSSPKPLRIWACRNLKTLHLEFARQTQIQHQRIHRRSSASISSFFSSSSSSTQNNNKSSSSRSGIIYENSPILSRIVFGYVARVCPRLQDLLIHGYRLNMTLQGGFCLLTRLRALKKVAISQYDCQFSTKDILPWVMKHKRSMSLTQRLQWWAIIAGWWKLVHGKELRGATGGATDSASMNVLKETETVLPNARQGSSPENGKSSGIPVTFPGLEKLGHLSDVVDILREIMAVQPTLPPVAVLNGLYSREPNPTPQGISPWAGHVDTIWPNLERVRIVYGNGSKLRRKDTFIRELLKRHRPEVEFQWVSWQGQHQISS